MKVDLPALCGRVEVCLVFTPESLYEILECDDHQSVVARLDDRYIERPPNG